MIISSAFSGRIVQLTDALDRFDAVSNHVCAVDDILKGLGFDALIASRFAHPDRVIRRVPMETLNLSCKDILIVHYYGYSDGLIEWLDNQYCTKVMIYHNITPHIYFNEGTATHNFCKDGRKQLQELIGKFHYFWGDSSFNVQELIELGVDQKKTGILPIVIDPLMLTNRICKPRCGRWVFVGRIAGNKGIVQLIDLFAKMHRSNSRIASNLTIIGGFDRNDPYYKLVMDAINRSACGEAIILTGKVSDEERDRILSESSVYVSLSQHEGFGVPLIEASHFDLPVVALDNGAIAETLGQTGVFRTVHELETEICKLADDEIHHAEICALQKANTHRFTSKMAETTLKRLLSTLLPNRTRYRTVSVVICTYNRREYLARCLEYLQFQSNDNFEVVVVDGPSNDGTKELIYSYRDRIKIGQNSEKNLSKSRNIGIELSGGDVIAFIDDDAIPFDDWIDQILIAYSERPLTVAGLGGPAYYAGTFWFQAEDNGINANCQVKVNIASDEIGKNGWLRYNTGTNATFSRTCLLEIDGFDEQYDYFLDESELCYRLQMAGSLIDYVPEIYVRHEFAQSHNRLGRFNYNWHTICKNTTYFLATHGSREGKDLQKTISARMKEERIAPLDAAVEEGKLSSEERDRHVDAVNRGVEQGLRDAKFWPRTRKLAAKISDFKRFGTRHDRPAVGRDLSPLHICIVSREAPPFAGSGGVGTLYYHLASELLLMGHHVSFVVPGGEDKVHRQGRLTVYFTKPETYKLPALCEGFSRNVEWSLKVVSRLAEIERERRIDVVDNALWDTEALAFSLIDRAVRPPLVVRLVTPYAVSADHNGWNPPAEQIVQFMEAERTLVKNADAVIPISNVVAETMIEKYGLTRDERWTVGHCGVAHWPAFDVNEGYGEFPELAGVDPERLSRSKLIVFVGRLERRKGIDLILEAAESFLNADPDAFLILAGRDPDGWGDRFRERLKGELGARFAALGEVSNATREKLLAHAFCLLFPSRYESFGLVPLEAFVHGTPVIAARAGAIPEVIQDGKSGIIIEPDDASALSQAVVRLMGDKKFHEELSDGALSRVIELNARNSALHTIEVYIKAIRYNKSVFEISQ